MLWGIFVKNDEVWTEYTLEASLLLVVWIDLLIFRVALFDNEEEYGWFTEYWTL